MGATVFCCSTHMALLLRRLCFAAAIAAAAASRCMLNNILRRNFGNASVYASLREQLQKHASKQQQLMHQCVCMCVMFSGLRESVCMFRQQHCQNCRFCNGRVHNKCETDEETETPIIITTTTCEEEEEQRNAAIIT